jgi:hypothetical protein
MNDSTDNVVPVEVSIHNALRHAFVSAGVTSYGAKRDYAHGNDAFFTGFNWAGIAFNKSPDTNGVTKQQFDDVKTERDTALDEWVDAGGDKDRFKQEWQQMKAHSVWNQPEESDGEESDGEESDGEESPDTEAQVGMREKFEANLRKAYNLASEPEAAAHRLTMKRLEAILKDEGINILEV